MGTGIWARQPYAGSIPATPSRDKARERRPMRRSRILWTDFSGGDANFVLRGKTDCPCSPGIGVVHEFPGERP